MAERKHEQEQQHEHGTMDISYHEKTFSGFLRACAWVAGVSIATLIFLALLNA